jgi:hypothetical protein
VVSAESVPVAYVALCLRLRRLVPALVDATAVDPVLCRAVAAEPLPTAAGLVREAGRLAVALPDAGLEPRRERLLAAQLHAVEWRARRLAGQHVSFASEVRRCLDVAVEAGEPDVYRAAHRQLATLLPGPGPPAVRLAAHRRHDVVPPDRLGVAVRALASALQGRAARRYGLPAGEEVAYRVVADGPWCALHTYRGGHRSIVQVNAGARPTAGRLARLVAHETYPGHHVECCRAELAVACGQVERGVTVFGSAQTVVSEGMAECALDIAVGPGWGPWAAGVLADAGVLTDGALAERVDPVLAVLRRVRVDAALLLHGAARPPVDAAARAEAHLRRWLLLDAVRARQLVDVLVRPLWRTQVVAAVEGAALVTRALRGTDPVAEHRRLLDDPLGPGALRRRTSTESVIIHDGR